MGTGGEVRLQVLICTIGAGGIARVEAAEHPQTEGVEYVVSWQQSEQTVLSLLECGVNQYLTFPVSLQRLRAKVAGDLTLQQP